MDDVSERDYAASIHKSQGAIIAFLVVIILLLVLALALSAYTAFSPVAVKSATHWEYMIEAIPDGSFEESINKLGAQGWELVSARRATSSVGENTEYSYEMIFKRPKPVTGN